MPLFDSHCHLDTEELYADLEGVLARAEQAGVRWFCTIGAGRGTSEAHRAVAIAKACPGRVWATVGVHPHDVEAMTEADFDEVRRLAEEHPDQVVGIGETGLDYYYDHSPRQVQREAFRRFLRLAREVKKPVSIHTRGADEDTLAILQDESAQEIGGVIHCFSHSEEFGREALKLGFYLSIPGIVTFKKSEDLREAVKNLPLERMMVETDSPYLAPVPMRGKRNEPAFVAYTAKKLAELKGVSYQEVENITTRNACALYRISLS